MHGTLMNTRSPHSEVRHTTAKFLGNLKDVPTERTPRRAGFVVPSGGYTRGMMNTLMHRIARTLEPEDGVIGRVALVVVIIALIIVFALVAFIIPGE